MKKYNYEWIPYKFIYEWLMLDNNINICHSCFYYQFIYFNNEKYF